jgi:hypothetical protein
MRMKRLYLLAMEIAMTSDLPGSQIDPPDDDQDGGAPRQKGPSQPGKPASGNAPEEEQNFDGDENPA